MTLKTYLREKRSVAGLHGSPVKEAETASFTFQDHYMSANKSAEWGLALSSRDIRRIRVDCTYEHSVNIQDL